MKTFWRILGFAKPIEKYAIPYFVYTLFHAVFNMFNFVLIAPLVETLFDRSGSIEHVTSMPELALNTEFLRDATNYALYSIYGENYNVMGVLVLLSIVIVFCSLLSNLFRYLGQRVMENMRINTLQRLRNTLFDNTINLHIGFFGNERKGDIIARITSDVQVVQYCITNTLQVAFREPFLIFTYVFAMFNLSWQLSIFSIVYLPVVAILIGAILKRLRRPAQHAQQQFGELTSVLDETLSGVKVVKGYNAEGFFRRKFHEINGAFSYFSKRMSRRQQLASPMSEFLGITAASGVLIFGGSLAMRDMLTAGDFIAFIVIFSQITRPLRAFTDSFANINQGIAAGERIFSLLDTKSVITNAPDAVELTEFRDSIEFRDVRFTYDTREVIGGVSFKVHKGETVALVGPSGGGKSTISDLIPRFYDVTGGSILIDGVDIRRYDIHSLREHMGLVAQETILFNDTIENNIRLGNVEATREQVAAAARVANADNFIGECDAGYDTNIGDRGMKLSGGQRQRLSIARAVLKNPDILILDEATSALDTESEKLVQEALDTLLKGRTTVVIAHRLSTIHNADRIIVIEDGLIAEQGTHAELMNKKGLYAKLIELQQLA